jgi:hypothetical protein
MSHSMQSKIPQTGKLQVQIFLSGSSPDIVTQLHAFGFESSNRNSAVRVLMGSLPAEELSVIVKIAGVQFVAPIKI